MVQGKIIVKGMKLVMIICVYYLYICKYINSYVQEDI